MTRAVAIVTALLTASLSASSDTPLEYRVKAAYLFNFTKFVEWPPEALAAGAPLTICVAAPNPFGKALEETVQGELFNGHPFAARVVRDPAGCHVLFVPATVSAAPLLREARTKAILTVGESADFLRDGGIVNFVMEDGKVRFEISQDAALRSQLRISSRLLRLARPTETR